VKYCIDYRTGGMGNTVLTHVLYSCSQIDIDFELFFSPTANAHQISALNKSSLVAHHLAEFPDPKLHCIIELYSDGWYKLLEHKMSYVKWMNAEPNVDNFRQFFSLSAITENNILWEEFYNAVRDPLWPESASYNDVKYLPIEIQQEIYQVYQEPVLFNVVDDATLTEFLSQTYFDWWTKPWQHMFKDTLHYPLSKYISNQLQDLKFKINEVFPNWEWDNKRSDRFHKEVISRNEKYFNWLEKIQRCVNNTINFEVQTTKEFLSWEKSIIIAKTCHLLDINPRLLNWQSAGCSLQENNLTLVNFLKRQLHHGKTI